MWEEHIGERDREDRGTNGGDKRHETNQDSGKQYESQKNRGQRKSRREREQKTKQSHGDRRLLEIMVGPIL